MEAARLAALIAAGGADPLLLVVVSGILGGGLFTAYAAARRAKPQAQLDMVSTAQLLLKEVRAELEDARQQRDLARASEQVAIEALREMRSEHAECVDRMDELHDNIAELQRELERTTPPDP